MCHGAVRNRDALRSLRNEMRHAQLDHLAGTDEQDVEPRALIKNATGQMHCRRCHRDDIGTNGGGGSHFLGNRKSALKKFAQQGTQGTRLISQSCRLFHLTEDLRLTQNHGIETAGNPKHVPDGSLL